MQGIIHHHRKASLSLKLPLRIQIPHPCGSKHAFLSADPAPAGKTPPPGRKTKNTHQNSSFSAQPPANQSHHSPPSPAFPAFSLPFRPHYPSFPSPHSSKLITQTSPFSPRQPRDCQMALLPSLAKFSSRRLPGRSRVLLLRFGDVGGIAQRSEQAAHNCLVHGSNPCAPISSFRFSPGMVVLPRRMHHDYLFAL